MACRKPGVAQRSRCRLALRPPSFSVGDTLDPAHRLGFVAVRIVGPRGNQQRLPASLGFEHPPTLPLDTLAGELAQQFVERLVVTVSPLGGAPP